MNCVIIGGGIIGLLTARELASAGAYVTVLERGECGRGSSWAGGGILFPLQPGKEPAALAPLLEASLAAWPALAAELAGETGCDPEWVRCGLLRVEDEMRLPPWAERAGLGLERLEGERLRALEPSLAAERAVLIAGVAQVRNPRLLRAVKLSLLARGVRIVEHTEVTELLREGSRVVGARAGGVRYRGDCTVLAAGAWSAALLPAKAPALSVVPVRGQMLVYAPSGLRLRHIVLKDACYLIPRRDGRILVGSTVEYVGYDQSATAAARSKLRQAAGELVPPLRDLPVEKQWAGLRPQAPGGVPYICPVPGVPGLFVHTGHFRNGVAVAPASARLLAQLLLSRPPFVDPAPYSLARQAEAGSAGGG